MDAYFQNVFMQSEMKTASSRNWIWLPKTISDNDNSLAIGKIVPLLSFYNNSCNIE